MQRIFEYNMPYETKKRKEPDVRIERHEDGGPSIGIGIPWAHGELQYFSRDEALMIAHALITMARE